MRGMLEEMLREEDVKEDQFETCGDGDVVLEEVIEVEMIICLVMLKGDGLCWGFIRNPEYRQIQFS